MFARVPVCSTNLGFSVENTNLGFSVGYVLCASYVHGQQAGCNYHCKSMAPKVLLHTHSAHYYKNYNPYRGGKDVGRTVSLQNKDQCGHYMYHCDQ